MVGVFVPVAEANWPILRSVCDDKEQTGTGGLKFKWLEGLKFTHSAASHSDQQVTIDSPHAC